MCKIFIGELTIYYILIPLFLYSLKSGFKRAFGRCFYPRALRLITGVIKYLHVIFLFLSYFTLLFFLFWFYSLRLMVFSSYSPLQCTMNVLVFELCHRNTLEIPSIEIPFVHKCTQRKHLVVQRVRYETLTKHAKPHIHKLFIHLFIFFPHIPHSVIH